MFLFLFPTLFIHSTLAASKYDIQSSNILSQLISDWYGEFEKAIYIDKLDQQRIYRLWNRGLVYNYYQKYDRTGMEVIFSDAYKRICNNSNIIRRMTATAAKGGIPNPFRKLYKDSSEEFRKVLYLLAKKGNWISDTKHKQKSDILHNQESLRQLKDEFSTLISTNIHLIPSTLTYTKQYLRNLSLYAPSMSYVQIDIGITTFHLSMDILPQSKYYYPQIMEWYLNDTAKYMAFLTISNLRQADKVINIISETAPELISIFMNTRQHIIDGMDLNNNLTRIEMDGTEILISALHSLEYLTFKDTQWKVIEVVSSCVKYLQNQAKFTGYVYSEARYEFAIILFTQVMLYCKALDEFYDGVYVIGEKYILSMVNSVSNIVPISRQHRLSSLFDRTYPELEAGLFRDEIDEMFLDIAI